MNFLEARTNMVAQQIRPWDVFDEGVLSTLSHLPREIFVPKSYAHLAYSDTEIPLGVHDQVMLSPKVVARALQALKLSSQDKVLEIGTGTGFVTACLSRLASQVISIEIYPELLNQAEKILSQLQCRQLILEEGNGVFGWEIHAPYDAILITGSYPLGVPQKVCEQLNPNGGRLFAICGQAPSMEAVLIERKGEIYTTQRLFETSIPTLVHAPCPNAFHF